MSSCAVSSSPTVLSDSAFAPIAVLPLALLERSAPAPMAVFSVPAMLLERALAPVAVLPDPSRVVVASGEDGNCRFYDENQKLLGTVDGLVVGWTR